MPLRPVEQTEWVRVNGDYEYSITAGRITDVKTGNQKTLLPSGKISRAIMIWVCTQAKVSSSDQITLPRSMRVFLEELGIPWSSQNSHEVINQLQALTRCMFTISSDKEVQNENELYHASFLLTQESKIRVADGLISNQAHSQIHLSPQLFNQLKDAVPIDKKSYSDLLKYQKTALTVDIYVWLCLRLYKRKSLSHVSWNQLHLQFGSNAQLKHFKQNFREALAIALKSFPGARVEEQNEGSRSKGFKGFLIYPMPQPLSAVC